MAGLFDATFRRRLAGGTDRQSMAVVSPVIGVALISARFLPARTSCGYRGVTSRGSGDVVGVSDVGLGGVDSMVGGLVRVGSGDVGSGDGWSGGGDGWSEMSRR